MSVGAESGRRRTWGRRGRARQRRRQNDALVVGSVAADSAADAGCVVDAARGEDMEP